jgi:hypothetical protein
MNMICESQALATLSVGKDTLGMHRIRGLDGLQGRLHALKKVKSLAANFLNRYIKNVTLSRNFS